MILFSARTPNGLKVPIALEELGVAYDLRTLDLDAGEQHAPAFLAINPNGRIPALVDTVDGRALPVFESGAILLHLAERHRGLLPVEPAARAAALGWLFLQVSGLGPAFGQAGWFTRQGDPAQPQARTRFEAEARRLTAVLETRLQATPWLAGDEYSVADIAHFAWLRCMDYAGLATTDYPAIRRWLAAITARPATQAALLRLGMA